MTSLDDIEGLWPPPEARDPTPRRHRHVWRSDYIQGSSPAANIMDALLVSCRLCGAIRDEAKARRGKSSRRLGGDQERRIERVYGPVKRGEYGDAVDHVGRVWRWQSKATRSLPPLWLAAIDKPTQRISLPVALERAHAGMAGLFDPRKSLVIRSFVRRGVPVRDWLFINAWDARLELGLAGIRWYVIPGDWWLDHFGRDE